MMQAPKATAPPATRFTQALVASDAPAYRRATQAAFLRRAAQGRVSKDLLGRWLANDRLYIHGYVRGLGRLLSFLALPDVPAAAAPAGPAERLRSWCIDALVNLRGEEALFAATAAAHGLPPGLDAGPDGRVPDGAKLEGLRRFEALFAALAPGPGARLPWLECAVVFYGTERCYLDAWSYARARLAPGDGGALRRRLMPSWTSPAFAAFVAELGDLVDGAVAEQVELHGEGAWPELLERALVPWRALLAAEEAFWPAVE